MSQDAGHIPASPRRQATDRLAGTLIEAWERAEAKPVNASYVATFADMAAAIDAGWTDETTRQPESVALTGPPGRHVR